MNEQELLQAIGQMMDEKLKPIKDELGEIHEELGEIQTTLNMVVEWIDEAAQDKRLPPFAAAK